MRTTILITTLLTGAALLTGPALGQSSTSTDPSATYNQPASKSGASSSSGGGTKADESSGKRNGAVNSKEGPSRTAAAPVAGANSFTEGEARRRIESFGYTDVTQLAKDDKGVWRGKATKNGRSVDVALDYQGNIVGNTP